jgi:hypothetical protein
MAMQLNVGAALASLPLPPALPPPMQTVLMRGAAMKAVQELLGHATMEMTNRYSHLSPEVPRHAVKLLDGLDRVTNPSGRQLGDKAHSST